MLKRTIYILLMTLLLAANAVAQGRYVIDVVCRGAERTYRINGEAGSTWKWTLKDAGGNEVTPPTFTWSDFTDTDKDDNPIQGSEITIEWDIDPGTYSLEAEQTSIHGCENYELGEVEVLPGADVDVGPDIIACAGGAITLSAATASNYSTLLWTTNGDGTFDDETALNPVYTPGTNDIQSGSVVLTLTAEGEGNTGSCEKATDILNVSFSKPLISLMPKELDCYQDYSGAVTSEVTGGFGSLNYFWSGSNGFTSTLKDITGLAAGKYVLVVTDSIGCSAKDSVLISQPTELIANVIPDPVEVCLNSTVNFIASATGGSGIYTFSWTGVDLGYLSQSDIYNPIFKDAPTGNYTYIFTTVRQKKE